MFTGIFPKPASDWPTWLVWIYWIVVGLIALGILIATVIKSYARIPQGYVGVRMRFEQPIRVRRQKRGEVCLVCDQRRESCQKCKTGQYCVTCEQCPAHDEIKIVRPGLRWQVPYTHTTQIVFMGDRLVDLKATRHDKDDVNYLADGSLIYEAVGASRSLWLVLFKSDELEKIITNLALSSLATAVKMSTTMRYEEIRKIALENFNNASSDYGVVGVNFILTSLARSDAQVLGELVGKEATIPSAVASSVHLGVA